MNAPSLLRRATALLLALAALASAETKTVTILHTNDLHGALLSRPDFDATGRPVAHRGGVARLMTAISAERALAEKEGRPVLLLDAGDVFHGTPEGNESKGASIVAWMNLARYDAMALGNHEWAYGDANLGDLRAQANFPFVSCTVTRVDPNAPVAPFPEYCKPFVVLKAGDLRVAVVGFTTAGTPEMNLPEHVAGLDFLPYVRQAAYYLRAARAEADIVVALTHLGSFSDQILAEKAPGWDLIVGGHDHRSFREGVEKGGTLIVQAGCDGQFLGRVDLAWDTTRRVVTGRTARLITVDGSLAEDASVAEFVAARVRADWDKPIGATAAFIGRAGPDSPCGCLVADAIRVGANADVAAINSSGVRHDLPAGPVTRRDVYMIAPFEDTLVTFSLSGAQLRSLLDAMFRNGRLEWPVSGAEFTVDPKREAGQRVVGLKILGKALDLAGTYTFATTRFAANRLLNDTVARRILAPGGTPIPRKDLPVTVQQSLFRLFEGGRIVAPPDPGRVTFVGKRK